MAPLSKRPLASPPSRAASFHCRSTVPTAAEHRQMRRPKTHTDLLSAVRRASPAPSASAGERKVPSKVLFNVTVQWSLGPVQVLAYTEWTVNDLVVAALKIYIQEERRPPLPTSDPFAFGIHYSQFSLQSLDPREKLIELGSRNFFLCPKAASAATTGGETDAPVTSSGCSKDVQKGYWISIPWRGFMDFLQ
ncbi:hypothetical protein HPP92_022815 [Vanilla planifolia]|uniref:DUF7054 domain-containing protein n=1 Tax=Vanilla planifolia TaxID=51239 RepID=A0A835Q1B9_VANPL|nr:hypothetical protein HPP92_022815 [Vanilla planifolia]